MMKQTRFLDRLTALFGAVVLTSAAVAGSSDPDAPPSVADQVASLENSCAASAEARAARHAERALYSRLGEYERIRRLTAEIVRLHLKNNAIKHLFADVDADLLAVRVADFMAAGTGGSVEYTGRDMPSAHAHLGLTDAHFLAAGGDVGQAMQNLGYGQNEIEEVVCILVSLRPQVVT